jgi:dihydropyrimidine dehydrogenase (NADP+)
MQSTANQDIFAGGDIIGTENLVDAVNDGKNASWSMHKFLQSKHGLTVEGPGKFPEFSTEIDLVDISTTMAGLRFENPFGLASAPPTTSYPMIKRAFELGWGFAVVKTFGLDKDLITNISPRIFKSTANSLGNDASYSNIELNSEKKAKYWVEGAKQIKKEFPNKVLFGSIMAAANQKDWEDLIDHCNEAGFDAVELNLSCNHGMPDKGMGKACSDSAEVVRNITKWTTSRSNVPVWIKMSPNSSINEEIALAA